MPDTEYTIALTDDRKDLVAAKAAEAGVTTEEYIQTAADRKADDLILVTCNDWWNGLSLTEKKAVYDSAQP